MRSWTKLLMDFKTCSTDKVFLNNKNKKSRLSSMQLTYSMFQPEKSVAEISQKRVKCRKTVVVITWLNNF